MPSLEQQPSSSSPPSPPDGGRGAAAPAPAESDDGKQADVVYTQYKDESQLPAIQGLVEVNLSEPYSVFTYRYFLNNWPNLCYLALDSRDSNKIIGTVVCKQGLDKRDLRRGYIAMLAVDEAHRGKRIGSELVRKAIQAMIEQGIDLVGLECEVGNKSALALYERLNFVRDKRLSKYYMSGQDAFSLKLWITPPNPVPPTSGSQEQ